MNGHLLHHLGNELRRSLYLARRYWVESLLGIGLVLSLFGGLLVAVVQVSGKSLDSGEVDGLIVGFAVWLFAQSAFGSISSEISSETEQRTLEQISLSPRSLGGLLSVRALLGLSGSLLLLLLTLGLAHALTDGRVQVNATVLAVTLLGAPSLMGVSYAMAGLMLLVKRGELLLVAAFPVLIGLVALPAYPPDAWSVLPYALSAAAARAAAAGEVLAWSTWGAVALNAGLYLLAGRLVFQVLLRWARRLGVLGHF